MVIDGIVEVGKQLGRRLGFPTANIRPDEPRLELPKNGVYVAAFWIDRTGPAYVCMLNQGSHPTAPEGPPTIEAHLLGFDGDLYGRPARVEYLHFLRPERRFGSLGELVSQLKQDRNAVRDWVRSALEGKGEDPAAQRIREILWIN